MKLVIERDETGTVFAYVESEKHFAKIQRGSRKKVLRLPERWLEHECQLDIAMPDSSYLVFDLKDYPRR